MKVEIHCKGMSLTDAIRDHVHEKLGKLSRLVPGEVEILTILDHNTSRHGGVFSAEISFRVWGHDVVASNESEDMYKTIALVVEQVLAQTRKLKEKRKTRQKGGETVRNYVEPAPPVTNDEKDEFGVDDLELDLEPATPANPPANS
ncbi:MAG: ribosome-associated translation inhibitor RaiA [Deltaproteobacteria bacterium]|nr:MAG: ribosome-associated translation inhibitor RaiA [Deltaproteobacteria bacterium]